MKNCKKLIVLGVCLIFAANLFALEGVVLSVAGKVEIQEGESWVPLEEEDIVDAGAVISTGFKSECVIALDETTLTVKALTRLTLEQLFEQDGNKASTMYLDAGSISASVRSEEDKKVAFKVKTPAVTASVRGTDGDVYINRIEGRSGSWLLTPPEPKMTKMQIQALYEEAKAILRMEAAAKAATLDEPVDEADGNSAVVEDTAVAEGISDTMAEAAVAESTSAVEETAIPAVEDVTTTAVTEIDAVTAHEEPVVAAVSTNTDELFSSLNQAGGVLVHEGEVSIVATTPGGTFTLNTPQQVAVETATSLGSSTVTPSTQESVSAAIPQPPVVVTTATSSEPVKQTGSVSVTIKWEDK